ncbi:hypothetical protein FJU08_07155 [Martelella alba]|uniref:Uncharacterized protein n=1 Tax=Martelella alba TaxID=2590451 RepID=A0A506UGX2_9HYPH|nr:hypothetical protein [Martelella alba]TPW31527.1 hypothetical protein FJU08_07155 [Martelella alba]
MKQAKIAGIHSKIKIFVSLSILMFPFMPQSGFAQATGPTIVGSSVAALAQSMASMSSAQKIAAIRAFIQANPNVPVATLAASLVAAAGVTPGLSASVAAAFVQAVPAQQRAQVAIAAVNAVPAGGKAAVAGAVVAATPAGAARNAVANSVTASVNADTTLSTSTRSGIGGSINEAASGGSTNDVQSASPS